MTFTMCGMRQFVNSVLFVDEEVATSPRHVFEVEMLVYYLSLGEENR